MTLRRKYNIITALAIVFILSLFVIGLLAMLPQETVYADEVQHDGRVFYFDSNVAQDGDGTMEKPFNNITRIAQMTFTSNDRVLFKYGSVFNTCLKVYNSRGTEGNEIYFGCYGDSALGKPKFNGYRHNGEAVLYIYNCEYITCDGFELFDSDIVEADKRGVLVESDNAGVMSNITVKNMYIHDIRGITDATNNGMSNESKATGGIQVWVKNSSRVPTRYHNLKIVNNVIHNVDNCGISIWHNWGVSSVQPLDDGWENIAFTDLLISNNTISNVGKNAIVIRSSEGGLVSHNTFYETALRCISGNQVFTRDCHGTVIENNEGFLNRMLPDSLGVFRDGSMIDPDLRSPETIWQYNYSHDNAFGLLTNCTDGNDENVLVRYNVSVADKSWLLNINYDVKSMYIYNNTFFIPEGYEGVSILRERDKQMEERSSGQTYYYFNNLVYDLGTNTNVMTCDVGPTADKSVLTTEARYFYSNLIYTKNGIKNIEYITTSDSSTTVQGDATALSETAPLLYKLPDATDTVNDRIGRQYAIRFALLENSLGIDGGLADSNFIPYNFATNDFFGTELDGIHFNIGAYGGSGVKAGSLEVEDPTLMDFMPFNNRGPEQKADRFFPSQDTFVERDKDLRHDESRTLTIRGSEADGGRSVAVLKYLVTATDRTQKIKLNLKLQSVTGKVKLHIGYLQNFAWFADTLKYSDVDFGKVTELAEFTLRSEYVGQKIDIDLVNKEKSLNMEFLGRLYSDSVVTLVLWLDDGADEAVISSYEDVNSLDSSDFGSPYIDVLNVADDTTYESTYCTWVATGSRANDVNAKAEALHVKLGSKDYCRYTLLQFDLSAFQGEVETAILKMYCNNANGCNNNQPSVISVYDLGYNIWQNDPNATKNDISTLCFNRLNPELKAKLSDGKTVSEKFAEIASCDIYSINPDVPYQWDLTLYIKEKIANGETTISLLVATKYNENKNTVETTFVSPNSTVFPAGQPCICINDKSFIDDGTYDVKAAFNTSNGSAAMGTISPQNQKIVRGGSTEEFTVAPYDGFSISSIKVNGVSLDGDNIAHQYDFTTEYGTIGKKLSFSNVTRDMSIVVTFDCDAKRKQVIVDNDTYVLNTTSNTNYANSGNSANTVLEIKSTADMDKHAYLHIDVFDIKERDASKMYELSMYVYQRSGMRSGYYFPMGVYLFAEYDNNSWKEDDLTYANKPYDLSGLDPWTTVLVKTTGWVNIDLTEYFCKLDENVTGITVVLTDEDDVQLMPMLRIYSSESTASNGGESLKPRFMVYDETVYNVSAEYNSDNGMLIYNDSQTFNEAGYFLSTRIVNNKGFKVQLLPQVGYMVGKVYVNGVETFIDGNNITLDRVTSDVKIRVDFVKYFSVNIVSDLNGMAIPGSVIVAEGNDVDINITPDSTYVISQILVNGNVFENNAQTIRLENIRERTDLYVTFEKGMKVVVNYQKDGKQLSEDKAVYIKKGNDVVVKLNVLPNEKVDKIIVGDREYDYNGNTFTLKNVSADTVITVRYVGEDVNGGNNTLWIVLGVTIPVVLAGIGVAVFFIVKRKNKAQK